MSHSADSPIADPSEDLLSRVEFARALAEDVQRAPRGSGFVIGLTGSWGSGKTSVLQLVEHQLGDAGAAVVHFNPWLFSGTEQLVEHFFAELSGQLEATGTERLDAVAASLRGYSRAVSPLRYLPWVGEVARSTSELAGDLGNALGGNGEAASAQVQAEGLKKKLAELERPILVIVDDVDRLGAPEIVDVVRLIRLVGDFPNLVYLVAFDLATVEAALGATREQGRAYLEKVVHITHALPPIRHEDLTAILQSGLTEAIPDPDLYRVDRGRLVEVFWTDVRPLFRTVRDVRRYCNAVIATLELIGDEVDLNDVLCLEALRLFEPEFFEQIAASRYALTGSRSPLGRLDLSLLFKADDTAIRDRAATICEQTGPRRDLLEPILHQLFPLSAAQPSASPSGTRPASEWAGTRRVADLAAFEAYLHRRLPPGALPSRQVDEIVRGLADERALDQAFSRLTDMEMSSLLARLADYDGELSSGCAVPATNAILRRRPEGFSDTFSDLSGSLVIHRLLDSLAADACLDALKAIDYPNLSCRHELLRMVRSRSQAGLAAVDRALLRKAESEIGDAVIAAVAKEISAEPDLRQLVTLAAQQSPVALHLRVMQWTDDAPEFLVRLVAAHDLTAIRPGIGQGGNIKVVQLDWFALRTLFDPGELEARLEQFDSDWVESTFDETVTQLWKQALEYAVDPDRATEDLQNWHGGAPPGDAAA